MRKSMPYLFCLLVLAACNSSDPAEKNEDQDKIFFPIAGTILAELKQIDSLPIAVIKYTVIGERRDTSVFKKEDLRVVADELMKPDISSPEYKKYFKETVFMDNTVNSITMSYTTESEKPDVRKIEVTLDPNNQRVRSIYVEKFEQHSDSTLLKKMVWTTGKSLQVISLINRKNEPEVIKTEKYDWGIN